MSDEDILATVFPELLRLARDYPTKVYASPEFIAMSKLLTPVLARNGVLVAAGTVVGATKPKKVETDPRNDALTPIGTLRPRRLS